MSLKASVSSPIPAKARIAVGSYEADSALRMLWNVVQLPIVGALLLAAPLVRSVCGVLMCLGLLVSGAFALSSASVEFPFWTMVALSIGFGALAVAYDALLGLLSR